MDLHEIVHLMNRLDILRRIHFNRVASECGIYYGQPPILHYIETHDRCSQCEVAAHMQVSPSSIATSVKRMQKAGLIQKVADSEDLRYNRLTLTEQGRAFSRRCRDSFDMLDEKIFSSFTEEEINQMKGYVERIIANLEDEETKDKSMMALEHTAVSLRAASERQKKEGE